RIAVASRVHVRGAVMDESHAVPVQIVLQALDRDLVAGNDRGREHYGVTRVQGDRLVLVGWEAEVCGELLAFRAGRDDNHLVAMRMRAANSSPWAPVERITILSGA